MCSLLPLCPLPWREGAPPLPRVPVEEVEAKVAKPIPGVEEGGGGGAEPPEKRNCWKPPCWSGEAVVRSVLL